MDLWELLKIMGRRWYVTLPVLAVTALVAVTLPPTIDPEYRASGTMILVGPQGTAADQNPFVTAGLGTNAEAAAIVAQSPNSKALVDEQDLSTEYTVEADGPVVVITATGETPSVAVETVTFVEQLLDDQLADLQTQAAVPETALLRVVPLIPEVIATPVYQQRLRVTILTVVIGVLVATLLAMAVEGLSRRRTRERRRERGPSSEPRPDDQGDLAPTSSPAPEEPPSLVPAERELSRPSPS
jgi:capsular polysaccharide biosynthesis protein